MDDEKMVRFERAVDRLAQALPSNSGNLSTINLNAGGVGVWIATTACAVMLAVNIVLVVILADHSRKIDDLNHYINAIYMMAPQLKPEK